MCGRFVLFSSVNIISREFAVLPENIVFSPNYNIAPTQEILIVNAEGERRLIKCRWGFIPPWGKDANIGYKMINARAETLAEKRLSNPPSGTTAVLLWRMDSMSGKRKAMRRNPCIYILSPAGPLDLQDYIVTGRLLKVDLYAHAQLSQPALIICWNLFIIECRL